MTSKISGNANMLGESAEFENLKRTAKIMAATDVTVLIQGESGTGKELMAKFIHAQSSRQSAPLVTINCAALPETLAESELFGHCKGAFTDASSNQQGRIQSAHNGTLFLDEIGEMPYGVQAKLLRALQEKEVRRLGSSKAIKIDIRVVSATNANLTDKIKDGEFREDLYYRLNTIPLNIPPLKDRKDEILQIANAMCEQNCKKYGFELKSFSKDAEEQLLSYNWPGNIRELISGVERAVILSENQEITADELFLQNKIQ